MNPPFTLPNADALVRISGITDYPRARLHLVVFDAVAMDLHSMRDVRSSSALEHWEACGPTKHFGDVSKLVATRRNIQDEGPES
jgi:hypothetical protein